MDDMSLFFLHFVRACAGQGTQVPVPIKISEPGYVRQIAKKKVTLPTPPPQGTRPPDLTEDY